MLIFKSLLDFLGKIWYNRGMIKTQEAKDDQAKISYNSLTGLCHWTRGVNLPLSRNFNTSEFTCKCGYPECVDQYISSAFIQSLQEVRDDFRQSIIITSGYRCDRYQAELERRGHKTSKHLSTHQRCAKVTTVSERVVHCPCAADITARKLGELHKVCIKYFRAIGVGLNFIHIDDRRDRERSWKY